MLSDQLTIFMCHTTSTIYLPMYFFSILCLLASMTLQNFTGNKEMLGRCEQVCSYSSNILPSVSMAHSNFWMIGMAVFPGANEGPSSRIQVERVLLQNYFFYSGASISVISSWQNFIFIKPYR